MLTEKQEEQAKEIAKDIAERASKGEFGWVYGRNGGISWEEIQKIKENTPPAFCLVNSIYEPIKED